MTTPLHPRERRPDESPVAYTGFVHFIGLGPSRSLVKAAKATGRSYGQTRKLAAKHAWLERVRLLENEATLAAAGRHPTLLESLLGADVSRLDEAGLRKRSAMVADARKMERLRSALREIVAMFDQFDAECYAQDLARETAEEAEIIEMEKRWNDRRKPRLGHDLATEADHE